MALIALDGLQNAARATQQAQTLDSDSESDMDSELDDEDVSKILIVTQTPPSRKREGPSRAGVIS
jgi:hypothetical protein